MKPECSVPQRARKRKCEAPHLAQSIAEALVAAAPQLASKPPVTQYVSQQLQFLPPYDTCALSPAARRCASEQARAIVRAEDPLLEQLMQVRAITTRRQTDGVTVLENHVNMRFSQDYCTMVHHERAVLPARGAVMFCFMASNQLEPIVVVVVVHPELGRLVDISEAQLLQLEVALDQFRKRFQLEGETYAYTGVDERLRGSLHSQHFHLKIRIPTEMYLQIFPAMRVLAPKRHMLEPCKRLWEPLAYKFERQPTAPWPAVRRLLRADISAQARGGA
jgi:hypothetical protein